MAVTLTPYTHPNQTTTEFAFGPWRARMYTVTFDSSYDNTNGEVVTAATLGVDQVHGILTVVPPYDDGNDLAFQLVGVPNSTRSQIALRAFVFDGSAAGQQAMEEATNTTDLSNFDKGVVVFLTT